MVYMAKAKKLPSGNWRVQVFIGKDANGKNIMKSFCAPTRKEAEKLAAEFELTSKKNLKRFTVGQAIDGYMDLKRNVLSPSTIHGYGIIRRNRLQSLMTMDIHEVDSFAMQKAINEDAAKLSSKSINEAKNLIVTALKLYGVKLELNVTLPPKKPKIRIVSAVAVKAERKRNLECSRSYSGFITTASRVAITNGSTNAASRTARMNSSV